MEISNPVLLSSRNRGARNERTQAVRPTNHWKTNDGCQAKPAAMDENATWWREWPENPCKHRLSAQNSASQAELLDGVLPRQQLGRDNADGREHREAAVVQLPGAHLLVVLPEAQGIAEVARL